MSFLCFLVLSNILIIYLIFFFLNVIFRSNVYPNIFSNRWRNLLVITICVQECMPHQRQKKKNPKKLSAAIYTSSKNRRSWCIIRASLFGKRLQVWRSVLNSLPVGYINGNINPFLVWKYLVMVILDVSFRKHLCNANGNIRCFFRETFGNGNIMYVFQETFV